MYDANVSVQGNEKRLALNYTSDEIEVESYKLATERSDVVFGWTFSPIVQVVIRGCNED